MGTRSWVAFESCLFVATAMVACDPDTGIGQTGDPGDCALCCSELVSTVPLDAAMSESTDLALTYESLLGPEGQLDVDLVLVGPAELWTSRSLEPPSDRSTRAHLTLRATGFVRHTDREVDPELTCCSPPVCEDFDEILVELSLSVPDLGATLEGSGSIDVWGRGMIDLGEFVGSAELAELGNCHLGFDPDDGYNALDCAGFVYANEECLDEAVWRDTPVDPKSGLAVSALLARAQSAFPLELKCGGRDWNAENPPFDPTIDVEIIVPDRYCPSVEQTGLPITLTLSGPALPASELLPAAAGLTPDRACLLHECSDTSACVDGRNDTGCTRLSVIVPDWYAGDLGWFELGIHVEDDGAQVVSVQASGYALAPETECFGQRVLE